MFTTLALLTLLGANDDAVKMTFVPSGATAKVGSYRPIRAEMDGTADLVKKAPEGLAAPKYGELKLGDKRWTFIVDEPEGKPAKLYVDTNADGDLTNDPDTMWDSRKVGNLSQYQGKSQVELASGKVGSLGMYRFDPTDPRRPQLKNTVLFYTDFGYEVIVRLDGKDFTSFVSGEPDATTSFWIDRDGNRRPSYKREIATVDKPFNFTGTSYVLKLNAGELKLAPATEPVPMTPMPPDLEVGKKAIEFNMAAMDGTSIDFPKTYAGKIVLLDFWATWCGPCIEQLPNVIKAHETWHDKGFEILGISLDAKDRAEHVTQFTKDKSMPWRQIYDGKYWDAALAELYDVSAIPFVLLVDGDSGEILATTQQLNGPGMADLVGKALEKKTTAK